MSYIARERLHLGSDGLATTDSEAGPVLFECGAITSKQEAKKYGLLPGSAPGDSQSEPQAESTPAEVPQAETAPAIAVKPAKATRASTKKPVSPAGA
ncbi:MAG TPA: hypothetical protein VF719_12280 [Abditibacteriaceae bacterium]|jgi:hypothetical protein